MTVWVIGYLFTWALVSDDDDGWAMVILTALFWPLLLGQFCKGVIKARHEI